MGFPITEAFIERNPQDGGERWVQYFEKALVEYHPELPAGQGFQLARLGAWRLDEKYPSHPSLKQARCRALPTTSSPRLVLQ